MGLNSSVIKDQRRNFQSWCGIQNSVPWKWDLKTTRPLHPEISGVTWTQFFFSAGFRISQGQILISCNLWHVHLGKTDSWQSIGDLWFCGSNMSKFTVSLYFVLLLFLHVSSVLCLSCGANYVIQPIYWFFFQIKCDQYWPGRGTETYGMIQVTLLDTIELATFCVRTFSLHKVRTRPLSFGKFSMEKRGWLSLRIWRIRILQSWAEQRDQEASNLKCKGIDFRRVFWW